MRVTLHRPGPPLAAFVAEIWLCEGELPPGRERVLPNGMTHMLVNLDADELRVWPDAAGSPQRMSGAVIAGPHLGHFVIDTAEQRRIVGVNFRPGGSRPFFAAPACAHAGLHVELDALWGRDGATLRERLLEAPTPAAMFATFEKILCRRAGDRLGPDRAIVRATRALDAGASVGEVQDALGFTTRRLLKTFSESVGATPKRWARVRRFQRVLAALVAGRRVDLAALAAELGYYDQAHMSHEFREFSGLTPSAYVARGGVEQNHVPLGE